MCAAKSGARELTGKSVNVNLIVDDDLAAIVEAWPYLAAESRKLMRASINGYYFGQNDHGG
jgi:hypothetical protein